MSRATLQQAEFDAAHLRACCLFAVIGQRIRKTAKLSMTERVLGLCEVAAVFADVTAVFVLDAFGYRNDHFLVLRIDVLDTRNELIHVEIFFRQINQIGAKSLVGRKRSRGCEPSRVSSHHLKNRDHARVVYARIEIDFHRGGGDIFCGAAIARAVVGGPQIVIDRLGHAHYAHFVAGLLHVFADLVACVHRVVAAVIEEITNVIFLENFKHSFIIGVVRIGISELIAHGTKRRRRRGLHELKFLLVFLPHINQLFFQNAFDTVSRTINLCDTVFLKSLKEYACRACVDYRRGPAGLSENTRPF